MSEPFIDSSLTPRISKSLLPSRLPMRSLRVCSSVERLRTLLPMKIIYYLRDRPGIDASSGSYAYTRPFPSEPHQQHASVVRYWPSISQGSQQGSSLDVRRGNLYRQPARHVPVRYSQSLRKIGAKESYPPYAGPSSKARPLGGFLVFRIALRY